MIFEGLAEKLQTTLQKLRGKGKLTEKDIDTAMREVRLALLEADVNYKVVKDFVSRVKEKALGEEVMKSLTPGQQVVKVVRDELTDLMGGRVSSLHPADAPPAGVMMMGLQGSGKTTSAAKLARARKKQGHNPLLVAADIYRPAAIRQLQVLGEQIQVPVFALGKEDPVSIAVRAREQAIKGGNDYYILDTAGRLHIDQELMLELERIRDAVNPVELLLVVDAMTGQDAVNVAQEFNQRLHITGVVLTKLDGDSRGGAALSVKAVTGSPIKFAATGEKLDCFEPFYPERMASRILRMGDVLTLIEKAQQQVDVEESRKLEERIRKQQLTLDDFLDQLNRLRQMGPLDQLMEMIPGLGGSKQLKNLAVDEKQLVRVEAIINSMTPEERRKPEIINSSRRRRIAAGSGTRVQDVNLLLKQFAQMRKMLKQFSNLEKGKFKGMKGLGRLLR